MEQKYGKPIELFLLMRFLPCRLQKKLIKSPYFSFLIWQIKDLGINSFFKTSLFLKNLTFRILAFIGYSQQLLYIHTNTHTLKNQQFFGQQFFSVAYFTKNT
jgi:hypothetical protein